MEELYSFSKFTAANPSNIFLENFLHAVQCSASDQSENALKVLIKLVSISCRGELPEFVSRALCSSTLAISMLKNKSDVCPIAIGEVLRSLIAKRLAKEAN